MADAAVAQSVETARICEVTVIPDGISPFFGFLVLLLSAGKKSQVPSHSQENLWFRQAGFIFL